LQDAIPSPVPTTRVRLAAPATWLRASVPVSWVQFGMLLAVLAALPFARGVDNDFWWHLRTGQYIFESGIPRHDPFSWTAAGQPWVMHEWLSEAIIYAVQSAFGYIGNMVLFIGVSLASIAISYALARRLGAGTKLLVGLLVLTTLTFTIFITPRPQDFTWLLFSIYLYVLTRHYEGDDIALWPLPVLMAFWVNLHLGFYYGLMLVGCWIAALLVEALRGQAHTFTARVASLRTPLIVAAACVLATFANPSGPAILLYPLRYVFDAQVTNSMVSEWQRPDITWTLHWSIFITAGVLVLMLLSRTRPRPFLALVSIIVVALSMQAVRNAPFAALVLLPVAGSAIAARWPAASSARDADVRVPIFAAAAMVASIALIVGPISLSIAGQSVSLGTPSSEGYPSAGADFVRAHYPDQRMFNDYNSGGYLIYKLYPEVPVFVDGRTDFYGNALLKDYIQIDHAEPGWDELLRKYGVQVILIDKGIPLATALTKDAGWQQQFSDDVAVVYTRR
jgi:hypothetical protein